MNSVNQRLPEPRSLFKVLPGDNEDQLAQQTKDQQQQREEGGGGLLPLPPAVVSPGEVSKDQVKQSQSPDTIPLDDSIDSQVSVPEEVTVGTNNSQQPVTTIRLSLMIELLKKRNERLNTVENEAKEAKRKLKSTQELLDVVSKNLNQSKKETKDLIQKNTLLLEELKMMKDKEDSSLEIQQLQRKELILLKVCLFVATLYIMCGGKIELVAFMALVWLAADIAR